MDNVEDFERARLANLRRPPSALPSRDQRPVLWCDSEAWVESKIPPRPWVVRNFLLRRSVTMAAGQGGAGKSSLVCAWTIGMALGEAVGRFVPGRPLKVLNYSIEDDNEELERRFSAALRQFGKAPTDIEGRIIRCGPTGVGTLIERDPVTGQVVLTDAWEGLEALLEQHGPDVLTIDPFVETHTADESDNTALRQVVAMLRDLAVKHDCAILLVHHTRKGSVAGDPDSIRGASAIVGATRIALTVTPMTEEEADTLGISHDVRRSYFRVDQVKANYSAAQSAAWHVLQEYQLDNGEEIAAAVPWSPPTAQRRATIDPDTLELIAAAIARGTPAGPYSPRLSNDQPRSVQPLLLRRGIKGTTKQKQVLQALLEAGFEVAEYRDSQSRPRAGLRHPERGPVADWIGAARSNDLFGGGPSPGTPEDEVGA